MVNVKLSNDDVDLLLNLLNTQRDFARDVCGREPTQKFLDLEKRIKQAKEKR